MFTMDMYFDLFTHLHVLPVYHHTTLLKHIITIKTTIAVTYNKMHTQLQYYKTDL